MDPCCMDAGAGGGGGGGGGKREDMHRSGHNHKYFNPFPPEVTF